MIKYLIMDVDGTLTDGKIYMGQDGETLKAFSIKDGYAINYILKPNHIRPIVITARTSQIVQNRCDELGIEDVYQGKLDKFTTLKKIVSDDLGACAYFGDDILDLKCMNPIKEAGGIVGCPADAVQEVKAKCDYVCTHKAGDGALREFAEWLIKTNYNEKDLSKRIDEAIIYLKSLDRENINVGRYTVNDRFYYLVQEYKTKSEEQCLLESHREYVDIQMVVFGTEKMKIADTSRLQFAQEYNRDNDIVIWNKTDPMMEITLNEGDVIVLYPENAHCGCISVGEGSSVRKIVGKLMI